MTLFEQIMKASSGAPVQEVGGHYRLVNLKRWCSHEWVKGLKRVATVVIWRVSSKFNPLLLHVCSL
jgi:hypothetical protein